MTLSPQAAALRAAVSGIYPAQLLSSSFGPLVADPKDEPNAGAKSSKLLLGESLARSGSPVGGGLGGASSTLLRPSATESSRGVAVFTGDFPDNADVSAGGSCRARNAFLVEVERRRRADREKRQGDGSSVRQLLATIQQERMRTFQDSTSPSPNVVGNAVAAIEVAIAERALPSDIGSADGAAGPGIAFGVNVVGGEPCIASTPPKRLTRAQSSPQLSQSITSTSKRAPTAHESLSAPCMHDEATSSRRKLSLSSTDMRATTLAREQAQARLQSPPRRFLSTPSTVAPPGVSAAVGSPSWTVYVENEPEILPKRMHELPQAFGRQSHQEWGACLRRAFECPSSKIVKPWDDRKSCPRSFEGFAGKDTPHTRSRSHSAPRLRGPGSCASPSRELRRDHLRWAGHLLPSERRLMRSDRET